MKCDEQQPVCKNCQRSKRRCYRGIRLNFTQYSIYSPTTAAPDPHDHPSSYRLLDQSITIASLYNNGIASYEPYMHLHSPNELRESDRQYERDINSSVAQSGNKSPSFEQDVAKTLWSPTNTANIDPYRRSSMPSNPVIASIQEQNPVYENVNLKDFLSDEQLNLTQLGEKFVSNLPPTGATMGKPQTELDAAELVSLIHEQKFYWLLDLLNGLNAWKLIITRYCLESPHTGDETIHDNEFLVRCLLTCSVNNDVADISDLLKEQSIRWSHIQFEVISAENLAQHETILISIAIFSLRALLRIQNRLPVENLTSTINGQINIFYQIISKYQALPQAQTQRLRTVPFVTTIQSITMLKYFLNKVADFGPIEKGSSSAKGTESESDSELTSTLTAGELVFLKNFYKNLDYSSSTYHLDIDPFVETKLDARKLRELIWYLIRTEHLAQNPDEELLELEYGQIFSREYSLPEKNGLSDIGDYEVEQAMVAEVIPQLVFPNEQGLAIYLVKEYINKRINASTPEMVLKANSNLSRIFGYIESSTMEASIKVKWTQNFSWMLH